MDKRAIIRTFADFLVDVMENEEIFRNVAGVKKNHVMSCLSCTNELESYNDAVLADIEPDAAFGVGCPEYREMSENLRKVAKKLETARKGMEEYVIA